MVDSSFFEERLEQSEAKARIVQKYFWAWANVILSPRHISKIAYIDLFAGPGRYKNGAKSTPIQILETAIENPRIRDSLVTVFNDKDSTATSTLIQEINKIAGLDTLKYQPQVKTSEVGEEIVKMFESMNLVPTLFFVDPWGYKGLSLRLINSVLKNWGCDCVFFFNYNRINMGITNQNIQTHMEAIFGEERLSNMQGDLDGLVPDERELYVVEKLSEALIDHAGQSLYVLPFRFRKPDYRTSHHLIFVTKHFRGYEIMKSIMAKESSDENQGVPSFEYSPAGPKYPILYRLSRPLEELEEMILTKYSNKTIAFNDLYEEHSVGTQFLEKNYRQVFIKLEENGIITASDPENKKRRRNTFPKRLVITFP